MFFCGILQIELDVNDGNDRVRPLSERRDFVPYGPLPRPVRHGGEFTNYCLMVRMLDA